MIRKEIKQINKFYLLRELTFWLSAAFRYFKTTKAAHDVIVKAKLGEKRPSFIMSISSKKSRAKEVFTYYITKLRLCEKFTLTTKSKFIVFVKDVLKVVFLPMWDVTFAF